MRVLQLFLQCSGKISINLNVRLLICRLITGNRSQWQIFWNLILLALYSILKQLAFKLKACFGYTYLKKSAFLTMEIPKMKYSSSLIDGHLKWLMTSKCNAQVKKSMSMILYWIPLLRYFTTSYMKTNGCNDYNIILNAWLIRSLNFTFWIHFI
jgi:hypothetical protein